MEQPRQISPEEMIRTNCPEMLQYDTLGFHLNAALQSIGSSLEADQIGAIKGDRRRSAAVNLTMLDRWFIASVSLGGIWMGAFSTSDLVEVARVLDAWCRGGPQSLSVHEFAANFPSVRLDPEAFYFDEGPAVYTARAWEKLLASLKEGMPLLYPAAVHAFEHPRLAQLYPFTSHWRLCFSTVTGPPALPIDIPIIVPVRPDEFMVVDALCNWKTLGKGTARVAVEIVLANMPPGCGPAKHMD